MLVRDGHLYVTMDGGVALCLDAATGTEKWKGRLGGNFSTSPVLVGDKIYAVNESGDFYIFKADPTGLEIIATNNGIQEISRIDELGDRQRKPGGGRKSRENEQPDILKALDGLVEPETRGDPMSPLRWTCKSTRSLAAELKSQGFVISSVTLGKLFKL